MLNPILIGFVAAVAASLPAVARALFPHVDWAAPVFVLGVACLAVVFYRFVLERRRGKGGYDGLSDLFIYVHSPSTSDTGTNWLVRGVLSFFLSLFGGLAGPEGAATELAEGMAIKRGAKVSRWFQQRRRTDSACALAAGVSAAFGAPFAATILSIELGVGGAAIATGLSAIVAFLGVRYFTQVLPIEKLSIEGFDVQGALYGFHFVAWREWLAVLFIGLTAGLVGYGITRLIRYSKESLLDLFQTRVWMRIIAGGILLFLLVLVYRTAHAPSGWLLEQVLWSRLNVSQVALIFVAQILMLAVLLSAFGTIGVLWPLFAIGGYFGFIVNHAIFQGIPGFTAAAGLVGAAAFWAAVLEAPLAGAIMAFELTHNLNVLFPCLVAAFLASFMRSKLKGLSMIKLDLDAKGVVLSGGRSSSVLEALQVKDAMVTDHETVNEREPVSELYNQIIRFRYPFIPVVNAQGAYLGLLTIDMIQEGWRRQDPLASNSPLSKLLEAKDLLYRSKIKVKTVKANDRLSVTNRYFNEIPCAPVLGDDGRVQGLLFVYYVRLAYDREVARRSLALRGES
jgi:CIC family chloride channel protein